LCTLGSSWRRRTLLSTDSVERAMPQVAVTARVLLDADFPADHEGVRLTSDVGSVDVLDCLTFVCSS